jgi:soluble lytic murein transglycosylase
VKRASLLALALALTLSIEPGVGAQERAAGGGPSGGSPKLTPTSHPALPGNPALFWLVPDQAARAAAGGETAVARFARGAKLIEQGEYAAGLPLVRGADLARSPLAPYAEFYVGRALAGLHRLDEAESVLAALDARDPAGYLEEAVPLRRAEVAATALDADKALDLLEDLSDETLTQPEEVFLRLGRAAEAAGEREKALDAYRRVYYEFPLSTQGVDAQAGIERLETPSTAAPDRYRLELARADRLFSARRWAQSRAAFAALGAAARSSDRELIVLRMAEADYYLDRHRAARDALRPYLDGGAREAEARFFHLTAIRALGDHGTYVTLVRKLVADHPDTEWAEEALNNLATHYIVLDDDEQADRVFRELLHRYPESRHADRAAWKAGWWSYRQGDFGEAADIFERAAATFPRNDYRPAWLYWAGRSREQMRDLETAVARYRLVVTDYQNSYYGRLASKLLDARREPPAPPTVAVDHGTAGTGVATDALIRALIAAGLYDAALQEVQYAQRAWGDSPVLLATSSWIRHRQGLELSANERFAALRGAINTMRRAYPQFMAAGGERLPPELLRVIFPLDYWPLIQKYANAHGLDPYLLTALMAQESTFTAEVRSHANAYGLMQLIPGTGRRVARQLGIRRFTTRMLTNPETNVRLGTKYFKDLVDRFGGAHYALASYNAGEHRVARWLEDAPGLPQDEFIDNIPFPETQAYVKRILGTAEDYRRLYGGGILTSASPGARGLARQSD